MKPTPRGAVEPEVEELPPYSEVMDEVDWDDADLSELVEEEASPESG